MNTTIDQAEVAKFSAVAKEWWNPTGKFKTLHQINPVRLGYILSQLKQLQNQPLHELKILDIGCGGGLVSVPLTRLGAQVTGIDASSENIAIAKTYALEAGLKIDYQQDSIENLSGKYDVILCLEIVEHVQNLEKFLAHLAPLLNPKGIVIFSTINRTPKAWLLAITAAEYILNWVPRGTHHYNKFVRPSELFQPLQEEFRLNDISGMTYNIIKNKWFLDDDIQVNYFLTASKI